VREAGEEFTGFLGNDADIRKMLKAHGTYDIDHKTDGHKTYRMHIFPFDYNEWLPFYYNNNQRFLQKRLPENVFKTTKIFEKAEIRWVCVDDLKKMRPQFRSYFQNIVDMMLNQKDSIKSFIEPKVKAGRALGASLEKGFKKSTEKKAPGKTRRSIAGGKKRRTRRNYLTFISFLYTYKMKLIHTMLVMFIGSFIIQTQTDEIKDMRELLKK